MMHQTDDTSDRSTLAELLAWGQSRLSGPESRFEIELLLMHALGCERAWLFAHASEPLESEERARFGRLVDERERGVPVAYLTGSRGFWTLDLEVSPATLIPRPETESLVEAALARLPETEHLNVADLGTGSGAIALAIARERRHAHVLATDISDAALAIARANARRNGVENVEFRSGSWYAPLQLERFALIASNPPYVAEGDPHVEQGDLRFEPRAALTSGIDGLDAIRELIAGAPAHLHPGGWLLLEHGYRQAAQVRALLAQAGLESIQTLRDLELRDRISLARTPV